MAKKTIKKRDDPALSKTQAEAGAKITATDVGRALAKWRRRISDLETRLRDARANQ